MLRAEAEQNRQCMTHIYPSFDMQAVSVDVRLAGRAMPSDDDDDDEWWHAAAAAGSNQLRPSAAGSHSLWPGVTVTYSLGLLTLIEHREQAELKLMLVEFLDWINGYVLRLYSINQSINKIFRVA